MIKFIKAVSNEEKTSVRLVFGLTSAIFAVVKIFDKEDQTKKPVTVKLWDLTSSSLEKTMSFWSTNIPYQPTEEELADAIATISMLVSIAARNVSGQAPKIR